LLKTKRKKKFIFDATKFLVSAFKIPSMTRYCTFYFYVVVPFILIVPRHVCYVSHIITIKYYCNNIYMILSLFRDHHVLNSWWNFHI